MISIAIDSMDNVHVVHCYEDGLRYLFRSAAGEWDVETVDADASGPLLLYRLALVLDARGQPHIGYVAAIPLAMGLAGSGTRGGLAPEAIVSYLTCYQ
jgi:hypothetical protein